MPKWSAMYPGHASIFWHQAFTLNISDGKELTLNGNHSCTREAARRINDFWLDDVVLKCVEASGGDQCQAADLVLRRKIV
jgi:hypothetical protein